MSDKAVALFRKSPTIKGINPLTGLPVYFVPFEPGPYRSKILILTKDKTYYTIDAGLTWEDDLKNIDIRQVDVILTDKKVNE